MTDDCLYLYAPLTGFLAYLARGWMLPFIVEPLPGAHGFHSLCLWRPI
jgi:hypothetical protein